MPAALLTMSYVTGLFWEFIYIPKHLSIAASETWFYQKELAIVFTEFLIHEKLIFIHILVFPENGILKIHKKYLKIRNSSLDIFKNFV